MLVRGQAQVARQEAADSSLRHAGMVSLSAIHSGYY